MKNVEMLDEFYKKKNGIFKYAEVIELGLNQRSIKALENDKTIEKVAKGIYNHKDSLIYSHETAAYIHNLSDRFPRNYTVTTTTGYHLRKSSELKVYYVNNKLIDTGVIEIKDDAGNTIKVYDKEKTVCDIIKRKDRIELQIYSEVIQNYFKGKVKMRSLSKYAKELGISDKVSEIIVLMTNS